VVLEREISQTSVDDLAQAMVGRRVSTGARAAAPAKPPGHAAPPLLQAEGLRWRDDMGVPRLDRVSLSLHPGEIVGVAGVSGNGQTELLEVLSGLKVPQEGTLTIGTQTFTPAAWLNPGRARDLRVAHVPEDRLHRALVLPFAAWESAALGHQRWRRYGVWAWMRRRAMREATVQMMEAYDVRPRNPDLRSSKFSGGNQQKLVLAREAQDIGAIVAAAGIKAD
jgi:simple sugar transport system ATP-binding protein